MAASNPNGRLFFFFNFCQFLDIASTGIFCVYWWQIPTKLPAAEWNWHQRLNFQKHFEDPWKISQTNLKWSLQIKTLCFYARLFWWVYFYKHAQSSCCQVKLASLGWILYAEIWTVFCFSAIYQIYNAENTTGSQFSIIPQISRKYPKWPFAFLIWDKNKHLLLNSQTS